MNVRRTAEVLDTVSRILRELPADVNVLGIVLDVNVMTKGYSVSVHLTGGITTLADFYGVEIKSDRRTGSQFTKYSITVDEIELYMLIKTTKGQ